MNNRVSRQTKFACVVLCCLLAIALISACTVYAAHTVGAEDRHCDCPVCRLFSVVGAVWALMIVVIVCLAVSTMRAGTVRSDSQTETPVLLFVKLNC